MLSWLRRNDLVPITVLLILSFIFKAKYILQPPDIALMQSGTKATFFTLHAGLKLYDRHPSFYVVISILLIFLLSLVINKVASHERLFHRKQYYPAFLFILLTSFSPVLNVFNVHTMAAIFLFLALNSLLQLYNSHTPRRDQFDIGLWIGLSAWFFFPSCFLVPFLYVMTLILRPFVLEELIAYLLGVITPVYLAMGGMYLWGNSPGVQKLNLNLTPPLKTLTPAPLILLTLLSFSMLVYALYILNQGAIRQVIAVRKKWNLVVSFVILTSLLSLFSVIFPGTSWIICLPAVSVLLSETLLHNREKYNTFTCLILILCLFVVQWVL